MQASSKRPLNGDLLLMRCSSVHTKRSRPHSSVSRFYNLIFEMTYSPIQKAGKPKACFATEIALAVNGDDEGGSRHDEFLMSIAGTVYAGNALNGLLVSANIDTHNRRCRHSE